MKLSICPLAVPAGRHRLKLHSGIYTIKTLPKKLLANEGLCDSWVMDSFYNCCKENDSVECGTCHNRFDK